MGQHAAIHRSAWRYGEHHADVTVQANSSIDREARGSASMPTDQPDFARCRRRCRVAVVRSGSVGCPSAVTLDAQVVPLVEERRLQRGTGEHQRGGSSVPGRRARWCCGGGESARRATRVAGGSWPLDVFSLFPVSTRDASKKLRHQNTSQSPGPACRGTPPASPDAAGSAQQAATIAPHWCRALKQRCCTSPVLWRGTAWVAFYAGW